MTQVGDRQAGAPPSGAGVSPAGSIGPVLIVIGGLPGSGKTTLLRRLLEVAGGSAGSLVGLDSEEVAARLRASGRGPRTGRCALSCTSLTAGGCCACSPGRRRWSCSAIRGPVGRGGGLS